MKIQIRPRAVDASSYETGDFSKIFYLIISSCKKMDQKWAPHLLVRDSLVMSFTTHYRNQSHIYSVFR